MSTYFRCGACNGRHPSRLRFASQEVQDLTMPSLLEVQEPCPRTGGWVRVGPADVTWEDDRPAVQRPHPPLGSSRP